ncbi:MAG: aminotransferase class V-fold PLP-dependent enzyme [Gemmatimonadetes bacterium]|nr:aminotransferase class V-fold PLP-dependent enzyme [Gemmatimonadota bacterium]
MSANRRHFLAGIAAFAAAAVTVPDRLLARVRGVAPGRPAHARRYLTADGMPAPPEGPLPLEFWRELRTEFLIPPEEAFFNTGTLGSSPRVVLDAVVQHMTHVDRDIAHWDYKEGHENFFTGYYPELWLREKLAQLVRASADEIALTQNATFGMNFVANGLDLGLGDEVLVMEGAHPGGRCGWELRDKRYGAHVRTVKPRVPPASPDELVTLYEEATTPQTRVWAIPHLTSGTAIRFPVQELCRRARERGIFSVVDGAQTCGHLAIDVKTMGCDAYFTSPHKWLLAPKGTGFLYVRRDALPRVWTTLASDSWDNHKDGAYRLMQYGTGNLSLLRGLEQAVDFHSAIGSRRVEERIVALADRLRAGLRQLPGVFIRSPEHPALRSATTVWGIRGMTGPQLQDALWERSKVRVRSMGDEQGVRQCCHIYNLEQEVDRTLETVRKLVAV